MNERGQDGRIACVIHDLVVEIGDDLIEVLDPRDCGSDLAVAGRLQEASHLLVALDPSGAEHAHRQAALHPGSEEAGGVLGVLGTRDACRDALGSHAHHRD